MDYRTVDQALDASEIRQYIAALELPAELEVQADLPTGVTLPTPPDYQPGVKQAVTVGSQIAEFAAALSAELRADIANNFLLAQLAADRWAETRPDASNLDWYNHYLAVMKQCGWMIEEENAALNTVSGTGVQIHEQIIGVLTALLGPAVTAASVIMNVLKGLKAMQAGQPFLTLFDHASQRAEAQLFQISYANAGPDKHPRIDLATYSLEAEASVTQVLFFKASLSNATLRTFGAKLSINAAMLEQIRGAIFDKVSHRIVGNVTSIEI